MPGGGVAVGPEDVRHLDRAALGAQAMDAERVTDAGRGEAPAPGVHDLAEQLHRAPVQVDLVLAEAAAQQVGEDAAHEARGAPVAVELARQAGPVGGPGGASAGRGAGFGVHDLGFGGGLVFAAKATRVVVVVEQRYRDQRSALAV